MFKKTKVILTNLIPQFQFLVHFNLKKNKNQKKRTFKVNQNQKYKCGNSNNKKNPIKTQNSIKLETESKLETKTESKAKQPKLNQN